MKRRYDLRVQAMKKHGDAVKERSYKQQSLRKKWWLAGIWAHNHRRRFNTNQRNMAFQRHYTEYLGYRWPRPFLPRLHKWDWFDH